MTGIKVIRKMLYCPKCRSTYEEGTQRFCSNDGGRLLPAPSEQKSRSADKGVFTSILGKMKPAPAERRPEPRPEARRDALPRRDEPARPHPPAFAPHSELIRNRHGRRFEFGSYDENDSILELEFDPSMPPVRSDATPSAPSPPKEETPIVSDAPEEVPVAPAIAVAAVPAEAQAPEPEFAVPVAEPLPPPEAQGAPTEPKLVMPGEIPSGTAEIGDRSASPAGRAPFTRRNPDALVGQTVKGRYRVVRKLRDDDISVTFLAEDQITENRKAVVRVFADRTMFGDEFGEESVALSHLNHPNIAAVFDSGELPEGNKFIVSEYVEGETLSEVTANGRRMNAKRAARIVRQISHALSEAHQNGVLHRDLRPENVVLTVSEAGFEQTKLINFEFSDGYWSDADLLFKAPEEVEGGVSTPVSEIYALGVVAYRLLTGRLPYEAVSERELVKMQTDADFRRPTEIVPELPPLIDEVIAKAMCPDPDSRYPKARDFGDAFFNALTAVSPFAGAAEAPPAGKREFLVVPPIGDRAPDEPTIADIRIGSTGSDIGEEADQDAGEPEREEAGWERRSTGPPKTGNWMWLALPILGALVMLGGLWGIWKFLQSRSAVVPPPAAETEASTPMPEAALDAPPLQRKVERRADFERFVNTREALKGNLAKNFLAFEIQYPQEWSMAASETNYLDVARRDAEGRPVEQIIITRYKSRGVMRLDQQAFPELVGKSNSDLEKILGESYKILGEGETTIQNGRWKAHEVRFQGVLPDSRLKFYARRLWIPVQVPSVQDGFVITLLATELAGDVKSVADVGTKGELAAVLDTFEPLQN